MARNKRLVNRPPQENRYRFRSESQSLRRKQEILQSPKKNKNWPKNKLRKNVNLKWCVNTTAIDTTPSSLPWSSKRKKLKRIKKLYKKLRLKRKPKLERRFLETPIRSSLSCLKPSKNRHKSMKTNNRERFWRLATQARIRRESVKMKVWNVTAAWPPWQEHFPSTVSRIHTNGLTPAKASPFWVSESTHRIVRLAGKKVANQGARAAKKTRLSRRPTSWIETGHWHLKTT